MPSLVVLPTHSWEKLSALSGVPVCMLMRANGTDVLPAVGQRIRIPELYFCAHKDHTAEQMHVLSAHESILQLCRRYGLFAHHLLQANGLTRAGELRPGMRLKIPVPPPGTRVVTAGPMDSLFSVALRCHVSPQALATLNKLPMDAVLYHGMQLYVRDARAKMGCKYCPV